MLNPDYGRIEMSLRIKNKRVFPITLNPDYGRIEIAKLQKFKIIHMSLNPDYGRIEIYKAKDRTSQYHR